MGRPFTHQEKKAIDKKIRQLADDGFSDAKIAKLINVSPRTVLNRRNALNIPPNYRNSQKLEDRRRNVEDMYERYYSISEIAGELKEKTGAIRHDLACLGLVLYGHGHHPKFLIGDQVRLSTRCPKFLQLDRAKPRTIVDIERRPNDRGYMYIIGSNGHGPNNDGQPQEGFRLYSFKPSQLDFYEPREYHFKRKYDKGRGAVLELGYVA